MLEKQEYITKMKLEWKESQKKQKELRDVAKEQAKKLKEKQIADAAKRTAILVAKNKLKKAQHDAELAKLKAERDAHNAKSKTEIEAAKREMEE
jgi:hypothetical protein